MGNSETRAKLGQQSDPRSQRKRSRSTYETVKQEPVEAEDENEEGQEPEEAEDEDEEGQEPDEAVDEDEEDSTVAKLTDESVLDCPICFEALGKPVFQCGNGHVMCSSCRDKVKQKCPACSKKVGSVRCRAIENVLDAVKVHCYYRRFGCPVELFYSSKRAHEANCAYAPFECPFDECSFVGCQKRLSLHLKNSHARSVRHLHFGKARQFTMRKTEKFVVFREEAKGTLFFLNKCHKVALSCIDGSEEDSFEYALVVRGKDSSLRFQSLTSRFKNTSTGGCGASVGPSEDFIELPSYLFGADGSLNLELCVWKKDV